MAELAWNLEESYKSASGDQIRVLQREIGEDSTESIQRDLAPFFELPCLIQLFDKGDLINFQGRLLTFDVARDKLNLTALTIQNEEVQSWLLERPTSILLTVWRLNEKLDGLQVNIEVPGQKFYFQLGCSGVLSLFLGANDTLTSYHLQRGAGLFFQNVLSAQPSPAKGSGMLEN